MALMESLARAWANTEKEMKSYDKKIVLNKVSVSFNEKQPTISLDLHKAHLVYSIDYLKKNITVSVIGPEPLSMEYVILCRLLLMRNLFPILPHPGDKTAKTA